MQLLLAPPQLASTHTVQQHPQRAAPAKDCSTHTVQQHPHGAAAPTPSAQHPPTFSTGSMHLRNRSMLSSSKRARVMEE